jgi:hypothetical protein
MDHLVARLLDGLSLFARVGILFGDHPLCDMALEQLVKRIARACTGAETKTGAGAGTGADTKTGAGA